MSDGNDTPRFEQSFLPANERAFCASMRARLAARLRREAFEAGCAVARALASVRYAEEQAAKAEWTRSLIAKLEGANAK